MFIRHIFPKRFLVLLLIAFLCGCKNVGNTEPAAFPTNEPIAITERPSHPDSVKAYYEINTPISGCMLYISNDGKYGIQIPDNASFYDMDENITRITFKHNDKTIVVYINKCNDTFTEYSNEDDVVESFAQNGLNFVGVITNLSQLYDNGENIGYQFIQKVTDVKNPYGEIYRYYCNDSYSIQASLPNLSDDMIDGINVYLDSFKILN